MFAGEVTCRSALKSRIPKTVVKRIRKLHLKVAEGSVKSRQASSGLKFRACSLFVCDSREKTEVRKRNRQGIAAKSRRVDERWTEGGGWGKSERGAALLTDAKTSGIVAKVKQTTVAVVRFRSTLATRKVSFELPFCRSRCGIIVPIRHYRRGELNKSGASPRSILSTLPKVD